MRHQHQLRQNFQSPREPLRSRSSSTERETDPETGNSSKTMQRKARAEANPKAPDTLDGTFSAVLAFWSWKHSVENTNLQVHLISKG